MSEQKVIDYLTEDAEIPGQKYLVLSILSPSFIKSKDNADIRGIKIRGAYATYEEALKRAEYLQSVDPLFNVFVADMGKWLPIEDDPLKATDANYSETKLNNLMKSYLDNQNKAKELYEKRKNELMMEALNENENKKKKKSKKLKKPKNVVSSIVTEPSNNDLSISELRLDVETAADVDVEQINENLELQKNDVEKITDEIEEKTDKIQEIEEELRRAQQIYDQLQNDIEKNQKSKK